MGYNKGNSSNYLGTEGCCGIEQREQLQLSGPRGLLLDRTKGTVTTIWAQQAAVGYNKGNYSNYLGPEGCCWIQQREQFQLSGHSGLLWDITKGAISTIWVQRAVVGYKKGNNSNYLGTEGSCGI